MLDSNTFSDTSDGLNHNVSALVDRHSNYQRVHNKQFELKKMPGSEACDPITIVDDDELDAMEINYIDLETDNETHTKGDNTVLIKEIMAESQGIRVQSVAKNPSPCNNAQGPDPARHTKTITQPLFRGLTKDDFPAPTVQSVPETRGIGFKTWYGTHDSYHAGNTIPGMQQKPTSRNPSIALYNEKRTKNTTMKDRDAPQFEMSVLNSKRKRTIGELGYDELILPAQVESQSEKIARMAKKRRQRLEKSDLLSQKDLDRAYGHENGSMTGENVELIVSPIAYETVARVGDERSGPSVDREPSPVGPCLSTQGHKDHLTTQRHEARSNGHMNVDGFHSTQTIAQDRGAQEYGDGINATSSSGHASRKPKTKRSRIRGPTNACGVYSPEKMVPVKRSNHGAFHCPRCDSQFINWFGVNYHFEKCVAMYGNPKRLKWNDHASLEEVKSRTGPASKNSHTVREDFPLSAASVKPTQSLGSVRVETQTTPMHVPIHTQMRISSPTVNMRAPLLDSETQESALSHLPEVRPTLEDDTVSPTKNTQVDHPKSSVEHRATASKGLSHETWKRFQETGDWNRSLEVDQHANEAQDEESEIPDVAYRYFVHKREWLETEEDAVESTMGPYHTMNEANAVAKAEVQSPQSDGFEGIRCKGWSYLYEQDEFGMQTHTATVLEIHIETAVHRGKCRFLPLVPPRR